MPIKSKQTGRTYRLGTCKVFTEVGSPPAGQFLVLDEKVRPRQTPRIVATRACGVTFRGKNLAGWNAFSGRVVK